MQKNMATPLQNRKRERAGNSSCVVKRSAQIPPPDLRFYELYR